MPVYEYYCEPCDGIFELVRTMREADEPGSCPLCDEDAQRVMPSTFNAFIMRGGFPRKIPDKGTYWHMGKEVSQLSRGGDPYTHPEIEAKKGNQTPPVSKQDFVDTVDKRREERRAKRERRRAELENKWHWKDKRGELVKRKGFRKS
ncbi:MAG: zinc ribbon domain-containing protein [Chloroflexi bacterium]|nr:zinc ribbon domain-containing protein [Chloroflexota bacterium]